jgi:hypothetical protein
MLSFPWFLGFLNKECFSSNSDRSYSVQNGLPHNIYLAVDAHTHTRFTMECVVIKVFTSSGVTCTNRAVI